MIDHDKRQGQNYLTNFSAAGVQGELYNLNPFGSTGGAPTQQVQAAIQFAYDNYILWLTCSDLITGTNGQFIAPPAGMNYSCPIEPGSSPQVDCPTCASAPTCSPASYKGHS